MKIQSKIIMMLFFLSIGNNATAKEYEHFVIKRKSVVNMYRHLDLPPGTNYLNENIEYSISCLECIFEGVNKVKKNIEKEMNVKYKKQFIEDVSKNAKFKFN